MNTNASVDECEEKGRREGKGASEKRSHLLYNINTLSLLSKSDCEGESMSANMRVTPYEKYM